jgi:hypothetical protein
LGPTQTTGLSRSRCIATTASQGVSENKGIERQLNHCLPQPAVLRLQKVEQIDRLTLGLKLNIDLVIELRLHDFVNPYCPATIRGNSQPDQFEVKMKLILVRAQALSIVNR